MSARGFSEGDSERHSRLMISFKNLEFTYVGKLRIHKILPM